VAYQADISFGAAKSPDEMLRSRDFRGLAVRRWKVSSISCLLLFVLYYGYILLIAFGKDFMAQKIGTYTTLAIPLGVLVIVLAFALTLAYVIWANSSYDPEVKRLKDQLR
jgi:uncharacterized membrane protein (DUF485 family)